MRLKNLLHARMLFVILGCVIAPAAPQQGRKSKKKW
jgi:hypothetical protein